jgi:antitoxin (DNA-binding transcriptional repressor) of toxin-antitoxin stability system
MKTITMMQLRKQPGEYCHLVSRHGESFLVTANGKPVFRMVPVEENTVIHSDGRVTGPKPLTFGLELGGEYGVVA